MASPTLRRYGEKIPFLNLETELSRTVNSIAQVFPTKKKKPGSRLWMRFDSSGESELLELDRNAIMRRASIPARDLRVLGPVFSESSHILARERSMVVNLEFIKAIVTAEELFLLDATSSAVLPFVKQLKEQFPLQGVPLVAEEENIGNHQQDFILAVEMSDDRIGLDALENWSSPGYAEEEDLPAELPFEFRVLEIALDTVCSYLEGKVADLETRAYPILDEFTKNVTSRNLELVRSLKSVLTHLTARVQKVRDELEQLLNDDDDMADLYLTRKLALEQHVDSSSASFRGSAGHRSKSNKASNVNAATSMVASTSLHHGVDVLEMLLEAYFMQLDVTLNKLTMVREYIDDTEDYINIQLDHQRNQLFQFQITLSASAFAIAIGTAMVGSFGMNIQIPSYHDVNVFTPYVVTTLVVIVCVFFGLIVYVYWKGLFEW